MQVRTVTSGFIFSNECTLEMLTEIAIHKDYVGMTQAAVTKLSLQTLNKASGGNGHPRQNGVGDLQYAKLRTVIVNKLQDSQEQGEVFKAGTMQFEFKCLPDTDAPKQEPKARKQTQELTGPYYVAKQGVKCTAETDPGKWAIWQHVWACHSFEEFFLKAPKAQVTRTGRYVTARSEMRWAVERGWVKMGTAPQQ